uniref:Protein phosphatase 6, regulatory subunit 2a n=1 Tax=Astyanax mexicanus TaxID=7994 RepID=W5L9W4_ASTMX
MFWKFDLHTTSHIDQLLDKEDVTLRELMEEEDVLQECKAQNRRLLLFLSQDHCMQELVSLITEEPPSDLEEKTRFFPNIACELLTSDVSLINDKLGGDESLLEKLYCFLEQDPPLNPLLASFFSKTIGNLIARKTEQFQVISFLRKKHNFISLVLNHIDASAMMDLLLRLISCVEPAPLRQEVLNWLNEERLIQRLTELMHTGRDEERQSNASQTLCDIIRLSRDQANQMPEAMEPDPLLAVLEEENVAQLLKTMFEGEKSEASVVNGTQVLLTLLETRRSLEGLMELYSQGCERSYTVSGSILRAIEPHLKDFQQLLLDPPKKSAILTTVGVLEQPLGNARLHVARLVASLLQTSDHSICQELCRLNTMDLLLDLFFKYTWNNFLHFQVELCVASILNHSAHTGLQTPTLQNHDPGSDGQKEEGTSVQNSSTDPAHTSIQDALVVNLPEDCRGRWESFVGETLRETNRRNTVDLVSTHNMHSSSEDDDMESPFPNDLSIQQAFSDYQIQQMTANFVDQFGFNDEEFSEHDENIATFDRIAEINFNIDADDNSANAAAFEACCKEKIQQFDDCEEEEDIWEDKEINYATQVKSRSFGVSLSSDGSPKGPVRNGQRGRGSASEEEEEEEGAVQPSTQTATPGWTASFGEAEDGSSGSWASAPEQGNEEQRGTGWANFTEFQPFCGTGEWEGRKAPLVASDSSSSGGSDSEEEAGNDKTEGSPKAPTSQKAVTQEAPSESMEKLTITDGSPKITESATTTEAEAPKGDSENTTVTDKVDAPSEITPNGPI